MRGTSTMLVQLILLRFVVPSLCVALSLYIKSPIYMIQNWFSFQKLPIGLRKYFPANGASTWIVLRHGFRAWPVEVVNFEFREGWDTFRQVHHLKTGFKVTMSCERKWIFHTAVFDANDRELDFKWSAPNLQWQEFHPPPGLCKCIFLPQI